MEDAAASNPAKFDQEDAMPNHAALNNVEHRDLRIDTRRLAALGDDVMCAATFPAEFRNVQSHYPIVFRRTELRLVDRL